MSDDVATGGVKRARSEEAKEATETVDKESGVDRVLIAVTRKDPTENTFLYVPADLLPERFDEIVELLARDGTDTKEVHEDVTVWDEWVHAWGDRLDRRVHHDHKTHDTAVPAAIRVTRVVSFFDAREWD
jgi:hypothetical protein